jgi:hypothetical protein
MTLCIIQAEFIIVLMQNHGSKIMNNSLTGKKLIILSYFMVGAKNKEKIIGLYKILGVINGEKKDTSSNFILN